MCTFVFHVGRQLIECFQLYSVRFSEAERLAREMPTITQVPGNMKIFLATSGN